MASSAQKSRGFSRKEQYSNFAAWVIAILGAVAGVVLLVLSWTQSDRFEDVRGAASDVTRPVAVAGAGGRSTSQSVFEEIGAYFRAGSKNRRLEKDLATARVRLAELQAVETENRRLKELLNLFEADREPIVSARLIGSTSSSTRRFATLSAGTNQGVDRGMPVRSERGLIGRVLETGRNTSRVLLVTDRQSTVPVRRAEDGLTAFAEGESDGTVRIRLVDLTINPLKPGDIFVTSGSGGYYLPNTPVAVVTELLSDGAIAQVLSNPAATEFVTVDPVFDPDAASEIE